MAPLLDQTPTFDSSHLVSRTSEGPDLDLPAPVVSTTPPTKRQLKRQRQKQLRLCSFSVAEAERQLLTFFCSVNGFPARVLIDGGAEGNVISTSFQQKHNLLRTTINPIPVLLPDGSSSITNHTVAITIERNKYIDTLNPILYPLKKYDLILGKPWLTHINPQINWRTNALHFTHNNTAIQWDCTGFKSKNIQTRTRGLLLTHLHFHTMATLPGSDVFLALVKSSKDLQKDKDKDSPSPPKQPPMTPEIRAIVEDEFKDVFPDSLPGGLPPDRGDAMKIETDPTADPPFKPVIRLSIAELDELRKQLDELLAKKFIKPSTSPYGAPVLFVRKKDGSLRMCVDYRGLNGITKKNRHPLPRIDELIDRFRGARYFSKLDLLSGYHQQRIYEPHTHKTAFRCRYGHFEFNVVPFGLTNAPASFSNMMLRVLDPVLDKWVVVYLDDILIYSKTKTEHLKHLHSVLALLRQHGLYAKLSKCSFMQEQTEFLGHTISKDGISTSAGLVKAIREWPRPSSIKDVQQFLGLAQFYHIYIDKFADIALPLSQLLAGDATFSWDEDKEQAFISLKNAVCSAPVLRIFDPDLPTTVETDASGFAIGAVLFQTDASGISRPVAFTSRKLQPAERNYPTHEQELLAVVHALRTWRYYLDGSHFIVYTDHATLRHFPTQPKLTRRQARWMELLQEYDFDFKYKRGADNIVPDALSRRPDHKAEDPSTVSADPVEIHSIDIQLDPGVRQRLIEDYKTSPRLSLVYNSCLEGSVPSGYSFHNGLLYYDRRGTVVLAIPQKADICLSLLHDCHDTPIAGHFGFRKTYDKLRRIAYWPNMAKETQLYVDSCEKCQRNKPSQERPAGLLQPLPIPANRWEVVTMDFMVHLPKTPCNHDAITVFVDKLTKHAHFVPSTTTATATDVARQFFDNVFRHHGMPTTIISDRDSKFTSHFWQELHRHMDVKLAMSTAYHPQTDGQTEVMNKTLGIMLRAFIDEKQTNWDILLPAAEFAYNNSVNHSTGYSPFFLNTGQHPRVPGTLLSHPDSNVPSVHEYLDQQSSALLFAQDALQRAQDHQKDQADKRRRDHNYKVGDKILLNAENITMPADSGLSSDKLKPRFIGPFTLLEQRSPVTFLVDLPPSYKIHNIFHVDLFRRYTESPLAFGRRTPAPPPPVVIEGAEEYEVESILRYRKYRRQHQFLVAWKGYGREDQTWEPAANLEHSRELVDAFKKDHGIVF
jgi:transposase InsO family protein